MKKPRLEAIEFIRGISMLGVIGIHIGSAYLGQHLIPEASGNAHLVALLEILPDSAYLFSSLFLPLGCFIIWT